jgi:curved DNA-binding protein CbpA
MGAPALQIEESRAATGPPTKFRVLEIRPGDRGTSVLTDVGTTIVLPKLVGTQLRNGDELIAAQQAESAPSRSEILIRKPNLKRSDIYQAPTGYARQPKPDRRGELFVRVQVIAANLGIAAIHIPCHVIRDYFFAANRNLPWNRQEPLYRFLRLTRDASFEELRLGFRIRRMELKQAHASRGEFAALDRAYNLLADPRLRAAYNELLIKPDAPVPFPYFGFGSLVVEGATEGDTFFARRIVAFLPERRHRTIAFPLRGLDFFSDHAILRDSRRKLEVLIDHQLLPLKWDQTWSQWRHLISASVEISAEFVRTGKHRKRDAEWQFEEWETALPSTAEVTVPAEVHESIQKARNAHSRFGRYFDEIDRLRWHVQQIPTECDELRRRCWGYGLPGDFDVKQITWRPDYDQYYYDELSKRARTMYLFRDEYIFDLERCVVVEVPQAGHATYIFARPSRLQEFVWQYAKTTRQEILVNRHNAAERLGFLGRVVHGANKVEWLNALCSRTGESPNSG